jgi:hypothetical protein
VINHLPVLGHSELEFGDSYYIIIISVFGNAAETDT